MKTYSLPEVAAQVLPSEWKTPVLWLQRRLRRKEIRGYKVGHDWRMTEADVADLVERYRNTAPAAPEATEPAVRTLPLTPRSARTLRSIGGGA